MNTITEKRLERMHWRRIALPASLLLNLFLIAVIGGHLLRAPEPGLRFGTPLARALANAQAILSPPDAAAFRAIMQRDAPRFGEAMQQLGSARRDLERQIVAEPYDREATKQALLAWGASWNGFLNRVSDPLVDALAQVSADGRRRLVNERRLQRLESDQRPH